MKKCIVIVAALLILNVGAANAQVLGPDFINSYTLSNLGTAPGVPINYGGIAFKVGNPNRLLIGGDANRAEGAIYEIGVVRDAQNHIVGYSGTATLMATAPFIDAGLAYGPGGVLFYTTFNDNMLGQIKPGSSAPDKLINLTPLGVTSSTGGLTFVPPGFPGAGEVRITSFTGGGLYSATITPDGQGTFNLSPTTLLTTFGFSLENLAFVEAGMPAFPAQSLLLMEWGPRRISAYELDSFGVPILSSRRDFMTDVQSPEGVVLDPLTNDFVFSTFGTTNQVLVVSPNGIPEPSSMILASIMTVGFIGRRRLSQLKQRLGRSVEG